MRDAAINKLKRNIIPAGSDSSAKHFNYESVEIRGLIHDGNSSSAIFSNFPTVLALAVGVATALNLFIIAGSHCYKTPPQPEIRMTFIYLKSSLYN